MRKARKREFSVVVHRDVGGYYVANVPESRGCHKQARSLDKLMERIREAIELCLEVEDTSASSGEFIGERPDSSSAQQRSCSGSAAATEPFTYG